MRGKSAVWSSSKIRQKEIVEAFYAAARRGDFDRLLSLLDPDVVLRADGEALPSGAPDRIRGAAGVAKSASFAGRAKFSEVAIVGGKAAIIVAPGGRLQRALLFTVAQGKVVEIDVVAKPKRLRRLEIASLFDRKFNPET